eukprot:468489_1
MLYKKLYLLACVLLSSPMHGSSTYNVSSDPSKSYQCPDNQDNCYIYCDVLDHRNLNVYDCHNAVNCHFHCDEHKCGENAVINAANANNLYINQASDGKECLKSANITTPNYGNASFNTVSKKGFKQMTVFAGTNANEITIDTSGAIHDPNGGEYIKMNVHASTARYLRITIGSQLEWSTATVECPVQSTYNGPDVSPCMIHASNGLLTDVTIIAPDGTPKNVYMDGCSLCNNVQIICTDVDALNGDNEDKYSTYPFDASDDCWWTRDPTSDPSTQPTLHPSTHPTISPTWMPSTTPTMSPISPSISPTTFSRTPTRYPSNVPSNRLSIEPTDPPSVSPSYLPSVSSTNAPSKTPSGVPTKPSISLIVTAPMSMISTHGITQTADGKVEETQYYWGKGGDWVIFVVVFVLFWLIIGACWCVFTNPARKARESKRTMEYMNQEIKNNADDNESTDVT